MKIACIVDEFLQEFTRDAFLWQSKEIIDLGHEDQDCDTSGKAGDKGLGNILEQGAHLEETHKDQDDSRKEGGNKEPLHAMGGKDGDNDDDEGTGGAADLDSAPSKEGDDESSHDCSQQSGLRRYSRGNGKRDCKGKGDYANDDSTNDVFLDLFFPNPLFYKGKELWFPFLITHFFSPG